MILFYFLFFWTSLAASTAPFSIRVLLEKIPAPKPMHVTLYAPEGFIIYTDATTTKKRKPIREPHPFLGIECQNGTFLLHTKPSLSSEKKIPKNNLVYRTKTLTIKSFSKTPLTINNKQYQGDCTIHINDAYKAYYLINTLALEEYVYSVLVCESYTHWPLEMQKIQAIATRTFAAHCMEEATKNKKIYDIKNSTFHQRYDGTHQYSHLREAIERTKNMIITHENKIALTMFDACCGGIIPSKLSTIDFTKAPYLKRSYRCTFCKNFSLYRWDYSCSLKDLTTALSNSPHKSKLLACGPLQNIRISDYDSAGSVHTLECKGKKKSVTLPSHSIKNCLQKGLKSKFFTIEQKKDIVTFKGKAFGHGLGLCQHGARAMITKKYDYKKILAFYFPGTKLSPLTNRLLKA